MISAVFYKSTDGRFDGFSVKGHAGLGEEGYDIVCASVSSSVMLTCNAITDFFKVKADVCVKENEISLKLKTDDGYAEKLIAALFDQFEYVAEQYGGIRLEAK